MKTFKKGDKVKVFNSTLDGKKFLEGIAIVGKKTDEGESFYNVRFISGNWNNYRCVRNLNEAELIVE